MRKPRLLIVDDDDNICQLVKEVAETCNYCVSIAHDEAAMVALYSEKQASIDVILLDLQLGDKDGIELLRLLGKNAYAGLVILFSGYDRRILHTAEQLGKALGLSMAGTLQKPVNIDDISRLLNNISDSTDAVSYERLREGIENFQMRLHYQPQIDMTNGQVIGVEALVRWEPKAHELIFPDAFIPIAESTNLIVPLTFWVIEEAFKQSVLWEQQEHPLTISINLSPKVLNNLSLPDKIQRIQMNIM
jgi:CheY-like chemotaxis protein